MRNKFLITAIILIALGAIVGGIFGKLPSRTSAETGLSTSSIASDYEEALDAVQKNYVRADVEHEEMLDSSIQSMLWTLDPHSSFFTKDEFKKLCKMI